MASRGPYRWCIHAARPLERSPNRVQAHRLIPQLRLNLTIYPTYACNIPGNFPPLTTSRPRRRSVSPGAHGPDTIHRTRSFACPVWVCGGAWASGASGLATRPWRASAAGPVPLQWRKTLRGEHSTLNPHLTR